MTSEERKDAMKRLWSWITIYCHPNVSEYKLFFDLTCELADAMEAINAQEAELRRIEKELCETHVEHGGEG